MKFLPLPSEKTCAPWKHRWLVRSVTPPMWDIGARGELWDCLRCGKKKAK